MPRANRYYAGGHVWHITHRCHQKHFLLKFARDRRRWMDWLFEAKKRYGLSVLNYVVTSNHIHLLVFDNGKDEIPASLQLVAGRVAQEYNQRKSRKGAFWEDRYHATAIDTDEHLVQCLLYIDMNMVRAGVVVHPADWQESGVAQLVSARQRYQVHDYCRLLTLLGFETVDELISARSSWIKTALDSGSMQREMRWTEGVAVGGQDFVRQVKEKLGPLRRNRKIVQGVSGFLLKEDEGESSFRFSGQNGDFKALK